MAAGDIIFEDGTIVTPNDMEKLMPALVALISSTQKDPGQYEEVKSLQGVSSLPVFQQAGNVYKLVRVAVELLKGVDGREIYLQVNADRTYIQWRWTDGVWQNLYKIEDLRGEPVVLRTGSQGIEWKYRDEADTAWRMLVTYEVLKLKYSDLTPEQVEDLWRHLPADVLSQFQKPATDAAAEVRKKMDGITEEANTLMGDVRELESSVSTAESERVEAEKERVNAESARRVAEVNRENSEDERDTAETGRVNAESTRVSNENLRKTAETGRVNAENTRVSQENARKTAETGRVDAEKARVTAENNRVSEFATLKQNAETATANANDTANHPTYIGEDHYVYKWNKATKAYDKTDIYVKGDAFSIKKVYASVAALQADVNNSDIKVGDFVLVNTNNVEDPDNAKLYVKVQNTNGSYAYDFLVDMSGAIGFTGKTPQLSIGTVSSGTTPAVTLSENGVDSNGNPRYKLNLVLPKGEKGEAPVLQIGTITTGTPGGSASASITANGSTSEGAPIFKLNMTIPQGPEGKGNVSVVESGLVSGKTYLFKPSANNSATGTLVDADEKYLKLTGGNVTGRISQLVDTDNVFHFRKANNESQGYIGYMNSISGREGMWVRSTNEGGNSHILVVHDDGDLTFDSNKVWHAGNDGSGSGLDADTVDNFHAIGPATNNLIRRGSVRSETDGLSSYWCKFASVNISEANGDRDLIVSVSNVYAGNSTATGILKAHVRIGTNTPPVSIVTTQLTWLVNKGIDEDAFKLYYDDKGNFELWCSLSYTGTAGKYNSFQFAVISEGTRTNNIRTYWTLYNTVFTTVQTPTLSNSITSTLLTLKNPTLQAKSLLTARTLWGQSFDGTGNVSGNMTNVGSITSSGEISTSALIKSTSSSSASGGFFRVGHPGAAWNTGLGAYNVDINTNTSQTPLVLAYRKGTTDYAGANRLFAAELLNDGSILKFAFAGAEKMSFGKAGDIFAAGKVTATTFVGALQGNATSATKLATARTINGVAFDGTSNITITAAANGGNSATVGGYSNSAILVTRAAPVNIDSTDSSWISTFNPTSAGTKPESSAYGTVVQFNNIQGGNPGTGGIYPFQLGYTAAKSLSFRSRYDNTAWTAWRKFIFEGDSRLTNARPANGGTSAACSGNAATATKLQTARKINGVAFDGTKDISLPKPSFSDINNVITHNNEFNVIDENYVDTGANVLWFNYRRKSGTGNVNSIYFGNGSGGEYYATITANSVVAKGYFYADYWFQNNRANIGLYNEETDTRWYSRSSDSGKWYADKGAYFEGTIWSHGFFKASDIRLKSDVKPLSHTLEQILSIPTTSFIMDGNRHIGSIAQEIEPDFPEIVSNIIKRKTEVPEADDWDTFTTEENGDIVEYVKVKTVEYEMLSVLALEGLKLLNRKVEDLKKRLNVK